MHSIKQKTTFVHNKKQFNMKTKIISDKDRATAINLYTAEIYELEMKYAVVSSTFFYDNISEEWKGIIYYYVICKNYNKKSTEL